MKFTYDHSDEKEWEEYEEYIPELPPVPPVPTMDLPEAEGIQQKRKKLHTVKVHMKMTLLPAGLVSVLGLESQR